MSDSQNPQELETTAAPKETPLKSTPLKSTGLVSFMTLLSRVLGLMRDIVIAKYFGASATIQADAFFVAFKIPNFLRRLFAEGAFSQAFVPVLSEYQTHYGSGSKEVKDLVDQVAGTLMMVLMLITLVGVVAAPFISMVFAPGFFDEPTKLALTADLLRLTFPYLLFISLTAFAGAILNSNNRFGVPAFTPVLLNLVLIAATLFLAPRLEQPVMALGWGVMIAGLTQLFFQLPFLKRIDLLPKPGFDRKHPGVQKIMKLMLPALFGVSVSQINLLLDTLLASFLQTGSISWLYFSDRLMELPLGVFGIAVATVILPSLSRQHSAGSSEAYSRTMDWGLRMVLLVGFPAALALAVIAEPLLATLFHYGAMTDQDVYMAAKSLRAYALGLLAFMLIKVLAPGYFSRQDTKTPVRIGIWAMVANMALNLALIVPLQHAGLALATSLAAFLNAGLLYWGLKRSGIFQAQPGWPVFMLRMVLACAAMLLWLLWSAEQTTLWFEWGVWQRALAMAELCVVGVLVYAVVLVATGLRLQHLRPSTD